MFDPQVLSTIEKTVGYIRKNGPSFEERLRNSGNPKFSFLNPDDAHHNEYLQRLNSATTPTQTGDIEVKETVEEARKLLFKIDIPPISEYDLDILKLAALFVARNGPEYGSKLLSHQRGRNGGAQFGFLDSRHSLNGVFQAYVYQYRLAICSLRAQLQDGLSLNDEKFKADLQLVDLLLSPDYSIILDAYKRAFHRKQNRMRSRNEKVAQQERQTRFASIDWQDFSLVGKLEFDVIDEVSELPHPLTRNEVIHRSLETRQDDVLSSRKRPAENDLDEKEKETSTDKAAAKIPGMKIKAAGESRLRKHQKTEPTIKCPISGIMVPELQFDSHLKSLLRDPRYQEQQDNYIKKNFKYASNLTTDQVYDNIKRIAKRQ